MRGATLQHFKSHTNSKQKAAKNSLALNRNSTKNVILLRMFGKIKMCTAEKVGHPTCTDCVHNNPVTIVTIVTRGSFLETHYTIERNCL